MLKIPISPLIIAIPLPTKVRGKDSIEIYDGQSDNFYRDAFDGIQIVYIGKAERKDYKCNNHYAFRYHLTKNELEAYCDISEKAYDVSTNKERFVIGELMAMAHDIQLASKEKNMLVGV